MKSILSKAKGITLIALVITIVIIIILAGVTINLSIGENGIFKKAKVAREQYLNAQVSEEKGINELYSQIFIANDGTVTIDATKLQELIDLRVEEKTSSLQQEIAELKNSKADKTELSGTGIQRTPLLSQATEISIDKNWTYRNVIINLNKPKTDFKYLEFHIDAYASGHGWCEETTLIIATDIMVSHNSSTISWTNGSHFTLNSTRDGKRFKTDSWFMTDSKLNIGYVWVDEDFTKMRVRQIYGIN